MARRVWPVALAALVVALLARGEPDPRGFEAVFNGKDFTGWAGDLANYEVRDGVIACKKGKGGVIYLNRELGDFTARVDYKVPPGGNNGLAIRYPGKGSASVDGMCEIQVLDNDHPKYAKIDPRQFNGSSYGVLAAKKGFARPAGEWNTMEVTARGTTLKVVLNSNTILEGDVRDVREFMRKAPPKGLLNPRGYFGFCGHRDPVEFRNIQLRELK